MKYLGIDYGQKKVGLSLSAAQTAYAWQILDNWQTLEELLAKLVSIVDREEITKVVVGLPRSLGGKVTDQTRKVNQFIMSLSAVLAVPVITVDETYTSQLANRLTGKDEDDAEAAALILQSYLDSL